MRSASIFILIVFSVACSNPTHNRERATQFYNEKKYLDALREINRAIDLAPDSLSYYASRSLINEKLGRYQDEIADLTRVIELNKESRSIYAYLQRSKAEYSLGLRSDALADVNVVISAMDSESGSSSLYVSIGSILYKLGEYNRAKRFYRLALSDRLEDNFSDRSQAYIGLSNLSESTQEALSYLDSAIQLDRSNALAYGARAAIFIDLGRATEAYIESRRALVLSPEDPVINFNMGQYFANIEGNLDSAMIYYEVAVQSSPQTVDSFEAYMNLAVLKHRAGKWESAFSDFKAAEVINPHNDMLLYNFGLLLDDMGKGAEAYEKFSKAISINSLDAAYYAARGSVLDDLMRTDEAEKDYLRAIQIDPKFGLAYYNLGYLYSHQKNHLLSIRYYDKAALLKYDLMATLVNRALEKLKIGDIDGACSDLKEAKRLGRNDVQPLLIKYCNIK